MALQQVLKKIRPEISDVRVAVNRRTARVDFHLTTFWIERLKFLKFERVSIEETDRHYAKTKWE
jgi:hypothetical protein